jgi:hypothetical protein
LARRGWENGTVANSTGNDEAASDATATGDQLKDDELDL